MTKKTSKAQTDVLRMPTAITRDFRPPQPEPGPLDRTTAERRQSLLLNMLRQIYQNARRAGATWIAVKTRDGGFRTSCDGQGEPDPSKLRHGDTRGEHGTRHTRLCEALTTSLGGPGMVITALRRTSLRVTAVSRSRNASADDRGTAKLQGWTVRIPAAGAGRDGKDYPHVKADTAIAEDAALLDGGTGTVTAVELGCSLPGLTADAGEIAAAARAAGGGLPLAATINGWKHPGNDYLGNCEESSVSSTVPWARIGITMHPWSEIQVYLDAHRKPGLQQAKIDAIFRAEPTNTNVCGIPTNLHLPVVAGNIALYRAMVDVSEPREARNTLLDHDTPKSRETLEKLYSESLRSILETVARYSDIVPFDTHDKARRHGVTLPEPSTIELMPWTGGTVRDAHPTGVYDLAGTPVPADKAIIVEVRSIDSTSALTLLAAASLRQREDEQHRAANPQARSGILPGDAILARPCTELAGYAAYDRVPRITNVEVLYTNAETQTRRPIETYRTNHLAWTTRVRHGRGPHRGMPRVPNITVKVTMTMFLAGTEDTNEPPIEIVEYWNTPFAIVDAGCRASPELGADEVLLAQGAERQLAAIRQDDEPETTATLARYLADWDTDRRASTHAEREQRLERMKMLASQLLAGSAETSRDRLEHELQRTAAAHADNRRPTEATIYYNPGTPGAEPVVTIKYED